MKPVLLFAMATGSAAATIIPSNPKLFVKLPGREYRKLSPIHRDVSELDCTDLLGILKVEMRQRAALAGAGAEQEQEEEEEQKQSRR